MNSSSRGRAARRRSLQDPPWLRMGPAMRKSTAALRPLALTWDIRRPGYQLLRMMRLIVRLYRQTGGDGPGLELIAENSETRVWLSACLGSVAGPGERRQWVESAVPRTAGILRVWKLRASRRAQPSERPSQEPEVRSPEDASPLARLRQGGGIAAPARGIRMGWRWAANHGTRRCLLPSGGNRCGIVLPPRWRSLPLNMEHSMSIFEEIPLPGFGSQPTLNPWLGPTRGSSGCELACSRVTGILRVRCASREMKNPPPLSRAAGSGGMAPCCSADRGRGHAFAAARRRFSQQQEARSANARASVSCLTNGLAATAA